MSDVNQIQDDPPALSRQDANLPRRRPWLGVLAAGAVLAVVGFSDIATGWSVSLLLLYLVPVAMATWFVGRKTGIVFCVLISLIRVVVRLGGPQTLVTNCWNTGILFGVLLIYSMLLDHLKAVHGDFPIVRTLGRAVAVGVVSACCLAALGYYLEKTSWLKSSHAATLAATAATRSPTLDQPRVTLADVVVSHAECMRISRPVLLGSRNPHGKSCLTPVKTGELTDAAPNHLADYDGGPGTTMQLLVEVERRECRRPTEDFAYHQNRLRTHLENVLIANKPGLAAAEAFSLKTQALANYAESLAAWPSELVPVADAGSEDWPGYCLGELNKAITAKDLPRTKRWSSELAGAAFSLADLHRWLAFLCENYLEALDFQKRCELLFDAADFAMPTYDPASSLSCLPAGMLTLHANSNFLEVERHAERMFTMPPDRLAALFTEGDRSEVPVGVPPVSRAAFASLAGLVSPETRRLLCQAASSPYEQTYLATMLNRAQESDTLEQLAETVRRFDALHRQATVGELMGVLMYRGHSFAGLEWGDRYQEPLVREAAEIRGTDVEAFDAACRFTNEFYHRSKYGPTLTLRQTLAQAQMDCVRATDMIGALFRNSGRPRFGHVRWCSENYGHSVAAYLGRNGDRANVLIADGLNPAEKPEPWPDAFFHGHGYPHGMENHPTPYCVELYVRGLDNYIWAEGYIIRGPNAGTLSSAAIPYSQHRTTSSIRKVFDGPYPE